MKSIFEPHFYINLISGNTRIDKMNWVCVCVCVIALQHYSLANFTSIQYETESRYLDWQKWFKLKSTMNQIGISHYNMCSCIPVYIPASVYVYVLLKSIFNKMLIVPPFLLFLAFEVLSVRGNISNFHPMYWQRPMCVYVWVRITYE